MLFLTNIILSLNRLLLDLMIHYQLNLSNNIINLVVDILIVIGDLI